MAEQPSQTPSGADKHTPGDWEVFVIASPAGTSYRIFSGDTDICHIPKEWNGEHNARLIAAAPELLATCQAAPVIRLGETLEQFTPRYQAWYRDMVAIKVKAGGGK